MQHMLLVSHARKYSKRKAAGYIAVLIVISRSIRQDNKFTPAINSCMHIELVNFQENMNLFTSYLTYWCISPFLHSYFTLDFD